MSVVGSCADNTYLLVEKVVSVSFSAACCIVIPLHCYKKRSRKQIDNGRECRDSTGFDAFYFIPTSNSIH